MSPAAFAWACLSAFFDTDPVAAADWRRLMDALDAEG